MKKQYRLLKDMPGFKAGFVFNLDLNDGDLGFTYDDKGNRFGILRNRMDSFPEWFEPVDARWKPEYSEHYWHVAVTGRVEVTTWEDRGFDEKLYSGGNCFKTEEQAQEAAKRVKATLLEYHEELNDD